ncbi:MAG: lycopene cyclase family protein [Myxococcota bacterium]
MSDLRRRLRARRKINRPFDMNTTDILVLGAGPTGTALAAALASRGLSVAQIDPAPERPWPNRYSAWDDELAALGLSKTAGQRWPRSEFVLPNGRVLALERGYAALDGKRLRTALQHALVDVRLGRVVRVSHHADSSQVELADGTQAEARLIVDATGHQSPFVVRDGPPAQAWQVAWGAEFANCEAPYATDAMRFMDWRAHEASDEDPRPTFLFAKPLGGRRWFFEETQLIGAPAMDLGLLERRLQARLARDGVNGQFDGGIERCCFPMDPPLPVLDQPVLGFGAAASLVHPATGYLLMRTLRAVAPVADALQAGIAEGRSPRDIVRDGWQVLWPPELLDAARLLRFGARTLLAMDREQIGKFYEAFFAIEPQSWRDYLSGDLPAGPLARIMLQVFAASGVATQWRLARQGLGDPWPLLKGIARLAAN